MLNKYLTRLTLAATVASYGFVAAGGVARSFGSSQGEGLLDMLHRLFAGGAGLLTLALLTASGQILWAKRPVLLTSLGAMALMSVSGAFGAGLSLNAVTPHLGVGLAFLLTWLVVMVSRGGETFHSRLSMIRSQWQVPLYAAVALLVVTVLGSYLKSLGAESVCGSWPLCDGLFTGPVSSVAIAHVAHRIAAALAGIFLFYTTVFVVRRHQNRPILIVLTGVAIVLFATQVVLGADAARTGLSSIGQFGHLSIATALIGTLVLLSAVGYYAPTLPVIAGASAAAVVAVPRPFAEVAKAYFELMKPRILVLLLITGYCAMVVAERGLPSLGLTLITMIGLGMSCGGANAINMWYDSDIDRIMKRTQKRPVPSGRLTEGQALAFGVMTGALSFVILAIGVNLLTAVLSLSGLLFYVFYTMCLKRHTTQNIVIGGAAGAVPPLVGWAAVAGDLSWAPIIMFLIVFMWTPPHFWALALFRNEDYTKAKIPMLPVVKGEMNTKWQILIYSVLLIPTVASLYWTGVVGEWYLWAVIGYCVIYLIANVLLFFERLPVYTWAKRSFTWSLFYLAFVFAAMCFDMKG